MSEKSIHTRLKLAHLVAELFDSRLPYFKGARQLRNGVTRVLAPELTPPRTVTTRYGFKIVITTDRDDIDYNLYARGTYEAGTLNIIKSCLREGDIFLDIGANVGLMSLFGSIHAGNDGMVYAIEPEPSTFELLKQNIEINGVKNIRSYHIGLAASKGKKAIYQNRGDNRGAASFLQTSPQAVKTAEVPVLSLDEFVSQNAISAIRMLKIDVEGWELEVLKGAEELLCGSKAPIIAIEYNTSFPFHREIFSLLTSINSYQIFTLRHANWYASQLVPIKYLSDLPSTGSPNLFCFLPFHIQTLDEAIFRDKLSFSS